MVASCRPEARGRNSSRISRGSPATRRHGAVPWRDGATAQPHQPWSSYACESHASSSGDGGWVERYAWASNYPGKRIAALVRESLPYGQVLSIADPVQIRQSLRSGGRPSSARNRPPIRHSSATVVPRRRPAQTRRPSSRRIFIFARNSSSRASHVCRQVVVRSPQNLSVFAFTSRVFTSSGATQYFC